MNFKCLLVGLLGTVSFECLSQSIYSALQHDRGVDLRAEPIVEKLIIKTTFINKETSYSKKDIIQVNSKHKIISESRFDRNGKLESRLTKTYDATQQQSLTREFERWHHIMGYQYEVAHYSYDDNGFLINVEDKNQNNITFRTTSITNNENGDPIELTVRNSNAGQFGKEIATYDYENNKALTHVLDYTGEVISESSMTIDFSVQTNGNIYNRFGDLIKSNNYEYEYKYDKRNNWTKKTIFKIVDGERTHYQSITRKVKYLK